MIRDEESWKRNCAWPETRDIGATSTQKHGSSPPTQARSGRDLGGRQRYRNGIRFGENQRPPIKRRRNAPPGVNFEDKKAGFFDRLTAATVIDSS